MKQITESDELRLIVPFAGWLDRHPTAAGIIFWIMLLALVYIVFTYNFTIPAYQ